MSDQLALAEAMFGYRSARSDFCEALVEAGFGEFRDIGGDDYDNSIEFHGVAPEARLNAVQQRIVSDAGFSKAYVNHEDGWETHYTWPVPFQVQRGWRRKRLEDGTFLISYWPEGWNNSQHTKGWLSAGYMKIVPDHLELSSPTN